AKRRHRRPGDRNYAAPRRLTRPRASRPGADPRGDPAAGNRTQAPRASARPPWTLCGRDLAARGRRLQIDRRRRVALQLAQPLLLLLALLFEFPLPFLILEVGFGQRFTFRYGFRSRCGSILPQFVSWGVLVTFSADFGARLADQEVEVHPAIGLQHGFAVELHPAAVVVRLGRLPVLPA